MDKFNYIISITITISLAILYTLNKVMNTKDNWGNGYYGYGYFQNTSIIETAIYMFYFLFGNIIGASIYFLPNKDNTLNTSTIKKPTQYFTHNIITDNYKVFQAANAVIGLIIVLIIYFLYRYITKEFSQTANFKKTKYQLLYSNIPMALTLIFGTYTALVFFVYTEKENIFIAIISYAVLLITNMFMMTLYETIRNKKRSKQALIFLYNAYTGVRGEILHVNDEMFVIKHSKGVSHINKSIIYSIYFLDND